jgi:hypothetical protein
MAAAMTRRALVETTLARQFDEIIAENRREYDRSQDGPKNLKKSPHPAILSRLWRLRHNTARPDILAADKPQPVEPLLVGQPDRFRTVAHAAPKTLQNIRPCNLLNVTIPQSRAIDAWNPRYYPRYLLQNGSQTRTFRLVAAGPIG